MRILYIMYIQLYRNELCVGSSQEFLSLLFDCKVSKGIFWHEPVVFEDTAISDHLHCDLCNVPCVIQTTVLSPLKPHPQALKHLGQVPTLCLIEAAKELSYINPLGGIGRERNSCQDTLRKQALLDVPRAGVG